MSLKEVHEEKAQKILEALKNNFKAMSGEDPHSDTEVHMKAKKIQISIFHGYIDRGPRTDVDYLSEIELDGIRDEMFEKHKPKIIKAEKLVHEVLMGFAHKTEISFDYGEKGHVGMCVDVWIDGTMLKDKSGKDIWADLSGTYSREDVMVMTPDVERYFPNLERATSYLATYEEEVTDLPF